MVYKERDLLWVPLHSVGGSQWRFLVILVSLTTSISKTLLKNFSTRSRSSKFFLNEHAFTWNRDSECFWGNMKVLKLVNVIIITVYNIFRLIFLLWRKVIKLIWLNKRSFSGFNAREVVLMSLASLLLRLMGLELTIIINKFLFANAPNGKILLQHGMQDQGWPS